MLTKSFILSEQDREALQKMTWHERFQWLGLNCKTSKQVTVYLKQFADYDYTTKGIDSQWCTGGRHSLHSKSKASGLDQLAVADKTLPDDTK